MKTLGAEPTTPVAANPVADCLRAARKRIEKPENWCKGVSGGSDYPTCAVIAIHRIGGRFESYFIFTQAVGFLEQAIAPETCAVLWNDAPERTHAEVLAAFDRAIVLAEQESA